MMFCFHRFKLRISLFVCLGVLIFPGRGYAQVVPSGGTATTVSVDANGRQVVGIAPALSGRLSNNTYNSFSVPSVGIALDNRVVGAGTIVNEVVSAERSVIQGPLEVLGTRAHVILANPNGITVDGGSFINTGGVALGAGEITLDVETLVAGLTRHNARLVVSGGGDIVVGPGGLAGTMPTLQLYAGRIKVDGPVTVSPETQARGRGDLALMAGKSEVTFDSSTPVTATDAWSNVTEQGTSSNEVLVDVTTAGALVASRVRVGVTEKGAGVSFAGRGLASVAEFQIDSTGRIGFSGADVVAETNVRIAGAEIEIVNRPQSQSRLAALEGALTLLAEDGDLRNVGGFLTGAEQDQDDARSLGSVTLQAAGDIENRTLLGGERAIAFAPDGDLVLKAGGNITNNGSRLLSNAHTRIEAGGTFENSVEIVGVGSERGVTETRKTKSKRRLSNLFIPRRDTSHSINYGSLGGSGDLAFVVGNEVTITAGDVINRGGEINANDGSIAINTGTFDNVAEVTGSADSTRSCYLMFCHGNGRSNLALNGGTLNASENIVINATGAVTNVGGSWVAFQGITVNAPEFVTTGIPIISFLERAGGLRNFFSGKETWAFVEDRGGTLIATDGDVVFNTDKPVINNGGQIVAANDVTAPSGIVVTRQPQSYKVTPNRSIGLLGEFAERTVQ